MKDPIRLCEIDGHGYEASLIRAAQRETPRPSVQRASAAALGLLTTSTFATGAAASGLATKAVLGAGLKGLILGVVVAGGAAEISHLREPQEPTPAQQTPVVAPLVTAKPEATPPPVANQPEAQPEPAAVPAPPTPERPHEAPQQTSEPVEKTLSEELVAFGRAQSALERGDAAAALAALANYEREFPRAKLAHEADVLRIEALAAAGRRDEALARARAFLGQSPNAPAARRIASLAERLENDRGRDQNQGLPPLKGSEAQ